MKYMYGTTKDHPNTQPALYDTVLQEFSHLCLVILYTTPQTGGEEILVETWSLDSIKISTSLYGEDLQETYISAWILLKNEVTINFNMLGTLIKHQIGCYLNTTKYYQNVMVQHDQEHTTR